MTDLTVLDDPTALARHREPMHARWAPSTGKVLSLDGMWDFHYAARPAAAPQGFEDPAFDLAGWSVLPVPANWELHGHGEALYQNIRYPFPANPPLAPEVNPTGSYRRWFDLPTDFAGQRVYLELGSADSACHVWVNGVEVGYNTDSKLPASFEVTRHLHPGRNLVAVRVYRWPSSAYLEKQDYWHVSGLQRSVRLIAKPAAHLRDWCVSTTALAADGSATVCARAWITLLRPATATQPNGMVHWPECAAWRICFRLRDDAGALVAEATAPVAQETPMYGVGNSCLHQEAMSAVTLWTVAGARLWSPETPTLYTVELELLAADDLVVDAEHQRVGLRVVAIRDGILMLNGRRLVVRGVNRHEWNPWRGRAVTEADMRADIVAMKRLNFNAVRTCHYPDTERWYELCDELGMAVVDEANLETHGLQAHLSRDPLWAGAYLERVVRMVLRDRNHACVVVWSLGNESFFGPGHAAMAAWVRQADPSRPVQYESGDPGAAVSDIRTPMYPGLDWVRQVMTDPADRRPMIMCEYAYAKGNSTGNVREFWDLVWEQPRFQGGFVWDWADKSLVVRDAAGAERHRYGTPGGESDGVERMCLNGVVGPDLVPHPGAYELKLHQSPVWLVVEDAATGRIRCHNRHHTLSLGHLALVWRLHDDGLTVAEGRCALPELVAGTSGVFNVDVPPGTPAAGATRWLDLRVVMVSATAWCPAGHEILATQARIGSAPAVCVTATGRVESAVEADGVLLTGRDWSARIDRAAGALTALRVAGRDLITRPFGPCLHRAPTDIDLLIGGGGYAATWAAAGLDAPVPRVHDLQVARASDNLLLVRWHGELALRHGHIQRSATWTIGSDGDLVYEETLVIDAPVPTLGRIGLEGSLSGACDQWRWVGRGPFENYPDRKDAALIGDHRLAVRDNLTPYIFPQECGLRCDVSWMALTAVDGSGLLVQGQPLLHASALPVRRSDLAAADNLADLVLRDDVAVHLDGFHQGLGGDTGWTRNVHAPYLLPPGRYRWSVRLRPLRVGEDPAHLGRSAMPGFPR